MNLVIISDTHGFHDDIVIPEADVLIHCGDWSSQGHTWEFNKFINWFGRQKPVHKIFINGNHELGVSRLNNMKEMVRSYNRKYIADIKYLEDSGTEINGLKFWGSPYTPEFFDWAYMYKREYGEMIWTDVPDDTDILITHGPPAGYMDEVTPLGDRYPRENAGCDYLLEKVKEIKPKIHCFGHIHGGYGVIQEEDTLFVNAASCDESYAPVNAPWEIEL